MAEVKTLQFPNTEEGQRQKVQTLKLYLDQGWSVISETITQGQFKGQDACCLSASGAACCGPCGLPLGFSAGYTGSVITVTLSHPSSNAPDPGPVHARATDWSNIDATQGI